MFIIEVFAIGGVHYRRSHCSFVLHRRRPFIEEASDTASLKSSREFSATERVSLRGSLPRPHQRRHFLEGISVETLTWKICDFVTPSD